MVTSKRESTLNDRLNSLRREDLRRFARVLTGGRELEKGHKANYIALIVNRLTEIEELLASL